MKFRMQLTRGPSVFLKIQLDPRRSWGIITLGPLQGEGSSLTQFSLTKLVGLEHEEKEISDFGFCVD